MSSKCCTFNQNWPEILFINFLLHLQVESFILDQEELEGAPILDTASKLLQFDNAGNPDLRAVDPETLEALFEAAGKSLGLLWKHGVKRRPIVEYLVWTQEFFEELVVVKVVKKKYIPFENWPIFSNSESELVQIFSIVNLNIQCVYICICCDIFWM